MSKRRRRQARRQKSGTNAPRPEKATTGVVDVVIPVFEQFGLLEHCLGSLVEAAGETKFRVIAVDDASKRPLKSHPFNIQLDFPFKTITNPQNRGFPFTANRGWKAGNGEFVLFLNSDVWLGPDSIETMVQEFVEPQVGIVGARLLFPEESTDPNRPAGTIQHAGMVITFEGKPIHIHLGWPADHPRANVHREMQLVTGACMMVRRRVLELTDGFSEIYGRGTFEDMELCIAARLRGLKVMYQPAAWGYHFAGGSLKPDHEFPIQENLMIWKTRCGNYAYWDEWRFW